VTKNTLHNLFSEIVKSDTLGESQKTSVVSLIHKGGDRAELKNWRPISLLYTEYKIIAKILKNRLKPLLEKAIMRGTKGKLEREASHGQPKFHQNSNHRNRKLERKTK
jgi:hypothetical protein